MTQPALLILGGINGAGKSTLAEQIGLTPHFSGVPFLNPDVAAAQLRAADPSLSAGQADIRGKRTIITEIDQLLRQRRTFIAETVLANNLYRWICEQAMAGRYHVRLVFVGLQDVQEAITRVALRVSKHGHNVATPEIERRWPKVHENLAWFAQNASAVDVFDNSGYGRTPRLIAQAKEGSVVIHDEHALPTVTAALQPLVPCMTPHRRPAEASSHEL